MDLSAHAYWGSWQGGLASRWSVRMLGFEGPARCPPSASQHPGRLQYRCQTLNRGNQQPTETRTPPHLAGGGVLGTAQAVGGALGSVLSGPLHLQGEGQEGA